MTVTKQQADQISAQVNAYRSIVENRPLAGPSRDLVTHMGKVDVRPAYKPVRIPAKKLQDPLPLRPPVIAAFKMTREAAQQEVQRQFDLRMRRRCVEIQREFEGKEDAPQEAMRPASIAVRAFELVEFQRKIRKQLAPFKGLNLTKTSANQERKRAMRVHRDRERDEAKHRQRLERQLKAAKETQMKEILDHVRAFKSFHRQNRSSIGRVNKMVMGYFQQKEREAMRIEQEKEKERMRMLMEKDEEGYRALIDKEKHKRLALLLEKTDEHMASMKSMVQAHQREEEAEAEAKRKRRASEAVEATSPDLDDDSEASKPKAHDDDDNNDDDDAAFVVDDDDDHAAAAESKEPAAEEVSKGWWHAHVYLL